MTATNHSRSSSSTDRWDNEGGPARPDDRSSESARIEMQQYGIVPVQLTVFDWGGYRYSTARDALAAAKRQTRAGR